MAAAAQAGIAAAHGSEQKLPFPKVYAKRCAEQFSELRTTFLSGVTKTADWRLGQLHALEKMLLEQTDAMADALAKDLGRPAYEAVGAEIGATLTEVKLAIANLKYWMRPETVSTNLLLQPGSSWIQREPKGVVLIVGPWNFPINLTLAPAVAAIAAGNCVVIKPSEVASATEALVAKLVAQYLDPAAIRVMVGGVPETTALLALPWNHIFYTGNGMVAKIVMEAAAKHLTPVTLELGGKSPVIVDTGLSDSQLKVACKRIMHTAAYLNTGQICVAPDFILVHADEEQRLLKMLTAVNKEFAAATEGTRRVVNSRHFDRLGRLLDGAGGSVICGGKPDPETAAIPATIVSRPDMGAPIMSEEIFGPLLAVQPVPSIDAAIAELRDRETPLALYLFSNSQATIDNVLANTASGGVCINDTLMHLGNPNLPFGGQGASGFGSYHGRWGFEEFSHKRSVLHRGLSFDLDRYPPYTPQKLELLKKVQRGELVPSGLKSAGIVLAAFALGALVKSRL